MKNNLDKVYSLANEKMQGRLDLSKEKALVYSLAEIIRNHILSPEYLGDMYLDFLNYKKELEHGKIDKFMEFFKSIETKLGHEEIIDTTKKGLNSSKREKNISILISHRLVKEYNLIENFDRYIISKR